MSFDPTSYAIGRNSVLVPRAEFLSSTSELAWPLTQEEVADLNEELGLVKPEPTAPTLVALGGIFTLAENAAEGAVAGGITGKKTDSTLSLFDDAGGRVALSGSSVVRGATALNYEAGTSHSFTVRETLTGATNTPRDTVFSLAVTNILDAATLNALSLNDTSIPEDQVASINIVGTAVGSTLTLHSGSLPSGMTLDSGTRIISGTPATPAVSSFTLRETLADSPNSPRDTALTITVTEAMSGGTGLALSAPAIVRVSGPTTYPPEVDIYPARPVDWMDGDSVVMQWSEDPLFMVDVDEGTQTFFAATTDYDFGQGAITEGSVYLRMAAYRGGRPSDNLLNWSNYLNVGDIVAPTLTNATVQTTWAHGTPILATITSDEPVYFSLGGTDGGSMELFGTQPGTLIQVGLRGGANTDYDAKSIYNYEVTGTDFAGNASEPLARTETISTPNLPQWVNVNGVNKSQYMSPSGTPRLQVAANAATGAPNNIRCTNGVTGKRQFEITITTATASTIIGVWVDAGSIVLGSAVFPYVGSVATPSGARLELTVGGEISSAVIQGNGGTQQTSFANGTLATGDVITVRFDTNAKTISFYRTRSATTVQLGSTLTGQTWMTGSVFAGVFTNWTGNSLTANFGTSAFARALDTGDLAYNA